MSAKAICSLASGELLDLLKYMFGIDDGDHAVELKFAFDALVDEKGLHHGRRIGQARGFDHERVEFCFVLEKLKQAAQEDRRARCSRCSRCSFPRSLGRRR